MRPTIWLCAFILSAGVAQASVELSGHERPAQPSSTDIAGNVWLQDRPAPGTALPGPDFSRPLLGPHGGIVARDTGIRTLMLHS